jgi:uncharacterized membrane protein YecN with MAPEG domain
MLILLALATRVPGMRRRARVSLGDGGNLALLRAVRAHGNAAEYIPAAMAALLFLSLMPVIPYWAMHVLGGGFTLARLLHAWGLSTSDGPSPGRVAGTALTFLCYLGFAGGLIWGALAPAS